MGVLSEKQLEKYAEALIWGLTTSRPGFRKYDTIQLRFDVAALDLVEILYGRLIRMKFNVLLKMLPTPSLELDLYAGTDKAQRGFTQVSVLRRAPDLVDAERYAIDAERKKMRDE